MFKFIAKLFGQGTSQDAFPRVEMRNRGREGSLVYVEANREASMYWEMSGVAEYDILAWPNNIKRWSNGEPIDNAAKKMILEAFHAYTDKNKIKVQWS